MLIFDRSGWTLFVRLSGMALLLWRQRRRQVPVPAIAAMPMTASSRQQRTRRPLHDADVTAIVELQVDRRQNSDRNAGSKKSFHGANLAIGAKHRRAVNDVCPLVNR